MPAPPHPKTYSYATVYYDKSWEGLRMVVELLMSGWNFQTFLGESPQTPYIVEYKVLFIPQLARIQKPSQQIFRSRPCIIHKEAEA